MGWHAGRSWSGTRLEDACPCPKEPCGLVDIARTVPECLEHPLNRVKTFRQGHYPQHCPGPREELAMSRTETPEERRRRERLRDERSRSSSDTSSDTSAATIAATTAASTYSDPSSSSSCDTSTSSSDGGSPSCDAGGF